MLLRTCVLIQTLNLQLFDQNSRLSATILGPAVACQRGWIAPAWCAATHRKGSGSGQLRFRGGAVPLVVRLRAAQGHRPRAQGCRCQSGIAGSQLYTAGPEPDQPRAPEKNEKWISKKEMPQRFDEEEFDLHLQSGRLAWRQSPHTPGVWEYQDTQDIARSFSRRHPTDLQSRCRR